MKKRGRIKIQKIEGSALVVFSGGQDSTTCLLWALKKFRNVSAITFNYEQRHKIEIDSAKNIIELLSSKRNIQIAWLKDNTQINHVIVDISFLSNILQTAMIQDLDIENDDETNLPTTFVPGRNILFLTIAIIIDYCKDSNIIGLEILNFKNRKLDLNDLVEMNVEEIIPKLVQCQ